MRSPDGRRSPSGSPAGSSCGGFTDAQLSSHVRNAFHAVSIDKQRRPFKPTLWTQPGAVPDQTVQQVWFSGVHTEVGGGSRDASLSDIALLWMVQHARRVGCGWSRAHCRPERRSTRARATAATGRLPRTTPPRSSTPPRLLQGDARLPPARRDAGDRIVSTTTCARSPTPRRSPRALESQPTIVTTSRQDRDRHGREGEQAQNVSVSTATSEPGPLRNR